MSVRVAIEHTMSYRFDRAVALFPHVVRLRPATHSRTPVHSYSLTVSPSEHFINWQQDPFGNHVARLVFPQPSRELTLTVDLIAELTVINPFDFFVEESAERYPFAYDASMERDLAPYMHAQAPGPRLATWLADQPPLEAGGTAIVDYLVALNQRVSATVAYTTRMEVGVQTPEETLEKALGSCRDSAWLLVHALRQLGLAARFVSGYLVQLRADEAALEGPSGPAADFTDLHAWAEVFVPGAGWIGLDATSGLWAGEGHIPLACSADPMEAAPVSGATGPCEVSFEFTNVVRRLPGPPRVTLPYTDDQLARIDALGRAIDIALVGDDVRLTQGGEPTFVSVDDMESPQWTTAADGDDKRVLAETLARRLLQRFAPGGLLHHGQGKWYPGEPLPRWQIGVLWRADGEALWADHGLLANPDLAGTATGTGAEDLARTITAWLGLPDGTPLAAYEDPLHTLLAEARLPGGDPPAIDVDPTVGSTVDTDARLARIAEIDGRGSGGPAGWAIPLHPVPGEKVAWSTTTWTLRRGHLVLMPGTSPMGLRLPLDALTWRPAPADPDLSPFADRFPQATRAAMKERLRRQADTQEPEEVPITALCVEVRDGHLRVFLPPLATVDQAVDLISVVESAAATLGAPVVLEGYPPPVDPRLNRLVVTPDPGVIEVNVQPAASWPELVDIIDGVHADARATRLGTETFHLDGTHAGTGGGNHLTLGGPTAADSPLLRRPDLLRSIVTYWQHHPSLSYLFSGRFIGPTSQAPRIDEARHESLYELEIAFAELDRNTAVQDQGKPRPWLVDRLFRNLLVDITGNTHRAELCIDKLFSPGTERGRLGLLEMRGFEMPPHPRMALVQAVLVRALVARFWADPYRAPLVRWGSGLHDRFLLPWYVEGDIGEVVDDLNRHGFAFEADWLAPFLEFRFPRIGVADVAGVRLELRAAIEPWSVLGEEVRSGGTSRGVDSSVERMQVRADGFLPDRHLITCNGVAVPLQPTPVPGRFVAGVRYRAWQPPASLHPTIGVHSPLVFDIVDRWSSRSLGGCAYHVSHPGGRTYDRFPVNANEAEARRASRFVVGGHTPGRVDIDALITAGRAAASTEYPCTLDLRRGPST